MNRMQPYNETERAIFDLLEAADRKTMGRGTPLTYAVARSLQAKRNALDAMLRASDFADAGDCATALYLRGQGEADLAAARSGMSIALRGKAGDREFDKLFGCARSQDRELSDEQSLRCGDITNGLTLSKYVERHQSPALAACVRSASRKMLGT